ncbi:CcdC protein domain-containing protein [Cohnella lubricantis]|uniref:DUF1453 family protein n=1 Tax=Cohnella lubricantis TaxID=2163172 RepID=A0A841TCY4_9BACL|nr:CcdC protein domain-containing protein [Cohnella lubricantis]MBB6677875.1 hypothetical protein [Cohnella lubricantis]MBP2119057.1 hypothetical protein [Cohnella lubricantis]
MTQQQWDLIGYGVWAMVIWMTYKQYRVTRKEYSGSGMKLLLGDWMLFAPVPWIVECMVRRAEPVQVAWTIGLGLAAAIPYILTSRFEQVRKGVAKFKFNGLFLVILAAFPYLRYEARTWIFHSHPILTPEYRPDIELMLAEYIAVMVIFTFAWRFWMFLSYRKAVAASSAPDSNDADIEVAYRQSVC